MKKYLIFTTITLLVISCSKSDNNSQTSSIVNSLKGKWKLEAQLYYDNQSSNFVHPVTNFYYLEMFIDGTFNSDYYGVYNGYNSINNTNYLGGTFTINQSNIITLTFKSNNHPDKILQKKISNYNTTTLDLSDDLTPNNQMCIEGCGERFSKVYNN